MLDYANGKIYKIVNDIDDQFYVGSTANFSKRLKHHQDKSRDQSKGKLHTLMRTHGNDHFEIILIEDFPCTNSKELRTREDYYIKLLKPTLNSIGAILDVEKVKQKVKEYAIKHKNEKREYDIKYRAMNEDKIRERKLKWFQDNEERVRKQKQEYRDATKAHKAAIDKLYREKNAEALKAKRDVKRHCELCNSDIRINEWLRHTRTQKHTKLTKTD